MAGRDVIEERMTETGRQGENNFCLFLPVPWSEFTSYILFSVPSKAKRALDLKASLFCLQFCLKHFMCIQTRAVLDGRTMSSPRSRSQELKLKLTRNLSWHRPPPWANVVYGLYTYKCKIKAQDKNRLSWPEHTVRLYGKFFNAKIIAFLTKLDFYYISFITSSETPA